MNNELRDDLISAAIDGERVDLDALRRALATDEGRESLAAFVMLRAASAADDIAPAGTPQAMTVPAHHRHDAWRLAGARVPLAWAASIAILAIAASFWFGTTRRGPVESLGRLAPATAAPANIAAPPIRTTPTAVGPDNCPPARIEPPARRPRTTRVAAQPPTPTRVLRFVPGVDWTSTPE